MEISVTENRNSLKPLNAKKSLKQRSGLKFYSGNSIGQTQCLCRVFNEWNQNQTVNLDRVKDFLNYRLETKSLATAKREKSLLKRILLENFPELNSFHGKKRIDLELSEIQIPEPAQNKTVYAMKDSELREHLKKFTVRNGLFVRFMYATACRVSEMLSIRLSDCRVQGSEVIIKMTGKGNKAGLIFCSVQLYNEILDTFKGKTFLFENKNPKSKKGQFTRQYIYEVVSRIPDFSPHKLRHSRATNLLKSGETLSSVSQILRHSSKDTTMKFYDHTQRDSEKMIRTEL